MCECECVCVCVCVWVCVCVCVCMAHAQAAMAMGHNRKEQRKVRGACQKQLGNAVHDTEPLMLVCHQASERCSDKSAPDTNNESVSKLFVSH